MLTCIANLSNDEVFTPPELANRMLDTLAEAWAEDRDGASLWADPGVRFLDLCIKSGIFLREIAGHIEEGLGANLRPAGVRQSHPDAASVWLWLHADDRHAGAARPIGT